MDEIPFTELLSNIVDNRGRTCPVADDGLPLIATNCITNERLHPSYDTTRRVSDEAYRTWFRGHPIPGDLIFVCKGSPGRVCMTPDPVDFCIAQDMVAVRPDSTKAYPKYLFAALRSSLVQSRIANMHVGTLIPHFKKGDFDKLTIPMPARTTQRAIGDLYFEFSAKIEQNRRTAQAVERLARAIFRAWFVDFEPVNAKAAGAVSFPSMPQPVFDALPARFVESDIGPVPEGWKVGAIDDLAALSKAQVKPQESPQEVFDHFSIPAFDSDMRPVAELGSAIKSNKFLVVDECVLLSKLNPRIPRVWLPPSSLGRRQISSTEFLVLVPRSAFDRHYLYCQFQQPAFREELAQGASGTSNSHQRIRPADLLHKAVIVPSELIRRGFGDIADPLFALAAAIHTESAKLAELRDYLLPKLLSGRVRVHEAERLVATAT